MEGEVQRRQRERNYKTFSLDPGFNSVVDQGDT